MLTVLTILTAVAVGIVVLVLAVYLSLVMAALWRANKHAADLATGLEAIQANTGPLPEHLTTINGALVTLLKGLDAIDQHIGGIARLVQGSDRHVF